MRAAGIELPHCGRAEHRTDGNTCASAHCAGGSAAKRDTPISALHAIPRVKHVFVVDDDVDVFSEEQMESAMATRFRAASDIVIATGYPGFYMDPTRTDS